MEEQVLKFLSEHAWAQMAATLVALWALKELGKTLVKDREEKDHTFEKNIAALNVSVKDNTRSIDRLVVSLEFLQKRVDKIPEIESDLNKLGESHRALREKVFKH